MANLNLLKEVIKESGMTYKAIARKSGIKAHTLSRRLDGVGEFTASEIVGLTEALMLPLKQRDDIFLR